MKVIASFDRHSFPPKLSLFVHWAPHERSQKRILELYKKMVCEKVSKVVRTPIDYHVDLRVVFIDPTSPDLDHLLVALYRALDGKSKWLGESCVVTDDSLISDVSIKRIYNDPALIKKDSEELGHNVVPIDRKRLTEEILRSAA